MSRLRVGSTGGNSSVGSDARLGGTESSSQTDYSTNYLLMIFGDAMGLHKNVASQKWKVFAFNRTTGAPQTGDDANITSKIRQDYGTRTASNDTNPTELEDGYYEFDLTQGETNGDQLDIFPESSTSNITVIGCPPTIYTSPPNFQDLSITVTDGRIDVGSWLGTAVTTSSTTSKPEVDAFSISDNQDAADNVQANIANLDGAISSRASATNQATIMIRIGTPSSSLATELAAVDTVVDAILVDTTEIGPAGLGLTNLGWGSTALTESYAAKGATATPAQLLYMIWSVVHEFGISGTTLTARKLDGSTAAITWTLNNDTNPTDRTRAS